MDEYAFDCRKCSHAFSNTAPTPSRTLHLMLGAITLGAWWLIMAFSRLGRLYFLSRCPKCGTRSRNLLLILILSIAGTLELSWLLYYFSIIAPERIVRDYSQATLPEDLDLNAPIGSDNFWQIVSFIWVVNILPGMGTFISANWPYILLAWFSVVIILGFTIPSRYLKRQPA